MYYDYYKNSPSYIQRKTTSKQWEIRMIWFWSQETTHAPGKAITDPSVVEWLTCLQCLLSARHQSKYFHIF